ncbi:unnamed protein product [Rotaria socialis]|uniref:F-box domain-containing protein n=1 Tax=Rotaria socialis TaxID=392032 RepID=A0A818LY56_9BILA|nr:unnamed protein product [Rotaria socialis]CAF3344160.1 unnamed protein product [Rotaria socialis]CAF3434033.1 unnamed protein product [Rotaria socialis]CAF3585203.1 unnamed protein product [Rotaria socialis]CAF3656998.1 unnamed protein product [Rotaria socialis]
MDGRRTLSLIAQESGDRRPSKIGNTIASIDDGSSSEVSGADGLTDTGLPRRRSGRVNALRFLPDNMLVLVFSYITPLDLIHCTHVCQRWHTLISRHNYLWRRLFLRPECSSGQIGAVHVRRLDAFLHAIATRFSTSLSYIDLPIELITVEVLRELAIRCPNLQYLTLDFSSAMQLHDFSDLSEFPCNLKRLCICLSEVIFLEGFMRRIYGFLSSIRTLHIFGTLEKSSLTSTAAPEETDDYETINISKIKTHAPNLHTINLYGVSFIDDSHIEAIASGCIHLQCLALNFCVRVKGKSFKNLMNRCRKLTCLLLQNTGIQDEPMLAVNWSTTQLSELDISSTDLSEATLLEFFTVAPKLTYLAVPFCDGFTDTVLNLLLDRGKLNSCRALDISNTVNLNVDAVHRLLTSFTNISYRIEALSYTGHVDITEQFWINAIRFLHHIKILVIGTAHSWFKQATRRIHVDQILEACAVHCPHLKRLEIQWDPETLRFGDNSSKFIDHLRIRCTNLSSFVLSDGPYYEGAKANFERAERHCIVRTTTMYQTSIVSNLNFYDELKFN